jgi:phosphatidylserine decarboxylase
VAITVAAFETQLDAIVTAIGDGDYATAKSALAKARAIAAGLPLISSVDGGYVQMATSQLDGLSKQLDELKAEESESNDNERRLISTQVSHG